ncbi:MAG: hypothetical protein KDK78_01660, partial [Chlamydiia bacterium]|nr:hypothetical protein [Chlamydiia bacterium]
IIKHCPLKALTHVEGNQPSLFLRLLQANQYGLILDGLSRIPRCDTPADFLLALQNRAEDGQNEELQKIMSLSSGNSFLKAAE